MVSDLTNNLPIFEEYKSLLPTAQELDEPLRNIYDEYVNFCIDTIAFFQSKPWSICGIFVRFGHLLTAQ
jgi:hypothetical protein